MRYRAYSGPQGSGPVKPIEKSHLLYKEFDSLDEALSWARHVIDTGRLPQLIEGDDGTHLDCDDIATALNHPHVRAPKAGAA
jgi:hypothetical protein